MATGSRGSQGRPEEGATGHLIHIGYPKTGSTFLQHWFQANPQLAYRIDGLAGFGSVAYIVRQAATGPRRVSYRVTSEEGLSMPRSHPWQPPSLDLAEAQAEVCRILAELFPNARILLVARGFRSMIRSVYAEWVRRGLDLGLSEFCARMAETTGGDLLDYDHLISLYRRAFGADRLLILPYELLRDDPTAFVRELETWLGLEHFPPEPARVNPAISSHELYWFPRIARVARSLPLPDRLKRRLRDNYHVLAERLRVRQALRVMGRIRPGNAISEEAVPDDFVESCRGKAESLRGLPLFQPYAEEYLF
jgi:hypothetical protein